MRVDVAFLPRDVLRPEGSVCIVVDLVRATTTMVTLFESGCPTVHVAQTVDAARAAAARIGALLCGERQGTKVPGFDYGNSPVEFSALDLRGRAVVLSTTNGTAAIHAVTAAPFVLIGCLRNASAVTDRALALAGPGGRHLTVVCAGREGTFALDDAYCAGYLVTLLRQEADPSSLSLTDSAAAAEQMWLSYDDPITAIRYSASGQGLMSVGLGADLPFVAEMDRSHVVPELICAPRDVRWPIHLA